MDYNMYGIEEIIEFKKCLKKFTIWLILLIIASILCIILRLQILQYSNIYTIKNWNRRDFFSYQSINQTATSSYSQFDIYAAMFLEVSEKDTIEKYEKILVEKNNIYIYIDFQENLKK